MKMQTKLLAMSLFPLIVLGLTTIIFGNARIREVVTDNIENGLRGAAVAVRDTIDYADEGELHVEDGILYKGEFDVTNATEIADHVKSATDMDITVFYGDTRYMSSESMSRENVLLVQLHRKWLLIRCSMEIRSTFQMMLT